MEYTNNRDFVRDEMVSGLAPSPNVIQDTWIGVTVTDSPQENCSSNGQYLHYNNFSQPNNYGGASHPDLLLGNDDEIDKVVHQLFQRDRTDSNGSLPVPERERTPSPAQDGFYEGRMIVEEDVSTTSSSNAEFRNNSSGLLNIEHILRGCDAVQNDSNNFVPNSFRPPSPPEEENQICLVAHEEYKEVEESFSTFTGNIPLGGSNVGYVATTFAPVPVNTSGDIPPPFGFYTSMSLPRDAVLNASSFVTRLSSLQPATAADRSRAPRPNAPGLAPRAMSSPKTMALMMQDDLQENIPQFYQPTIRRKRPVSIEERSPLIAALLKSQTSIFTQSPSQYQNCDAAIVRHDQRGVPQETFSTTLNPIVETPVNSVLIAPKPPRRRKQSFLREEHRSIVVNPAVITLDDADDKEDVQILDDCGSVYSFVSYPSSPYHCPPAKNPSVVVFPNMRDFSVGDPNIFKTRRFSLCEQSKIIVGRVLAYNKEVRRRMGTGYVGPWLSPAKLTSNMTGVSTTVVKQCEAYSTRVLTRCSSGVRQPFPLEPFFPERYQIVDPGPVLQGTMPIPMNIEQALAEEEITSNKAASVSSKSASPQPVDGEFDWSSLYNGKPLKTERKKCTSHKRTFPLVDYTPVKRPRAESTGDGEILDDNKVISNLLTDLVDKVSDDGSSRSRKKTRPFRTLKEALYDQEEEANPTLCSGILRRTLVRRAHSKQSVPCLSDGNSPYNFRPRESIVKKRFFFD